MGPSWTEIQKFSLIDLVQETKKWFWSNFSAPDRFRVYVASYYYKSYMNLLIALVLEYQDSLQDIPGPKCKNSFQKQLECV